jgi:hypothetical protein
MKAPSFLTNLLPYFLPKMGEAGGGKDRFTVSPNLITDAGWQTISGRKHERSWSEIQELYTDALTAWRKNPMAWRVINTTVNYVVGTGIKISSPDAEMHKFIQAFWDHRKNKMDLRLVPMVEELSRSGDLFVLLFRNAVDGMSYIRFVTKDQILKIETAPNDWETELVYYEAPPVGEYEPRKWFSPEHPEAGLADAVMLHYAVNRPVGALMGESDLTTIIPWLLRYSRMLEDRVRLHWAARAFLYLVTVPSNKVESKSVQYGSAPESGSIVVKDESETWETLTPSLRGADAGHDMKAVRNMIDAGSGFPPHWRGEGGEVNVATAEAMQAPPEKFLIKRQEYFVWCLQDILYQAFLRAVEIGAMPTASSTHPLPVTPLADYNELFTVEAPDVTLRDNDQLANGSLKLSEAFATLQNTLLGKSPTLHRIATDLVLKFAGEPQEDEVLDQIISEVKADPIQQVLLPGKEPAADIPNNGGNRELHP